MEEFRAVPNIPYEVSNLGNVNRISKKGKRYNVSCSIISSGYKYFQIKLEDGKRCNKMIHHLVALLFIGPRPQNFVIDHIDRNKLNNRVENLRYVSYTDNNRNTSRYRADIEEQDIKIRHRILSKEHYNKVKNDPNKYELYKMKCKLNRIKRNNKKLKDILNETIEIMDNLAQVVKDLVSP